MKPRNKYKVIGLMSGTSLDGLDLVYCKIKCGKKSKKFEILSATTKKYTADWKRKLSSAHTLTAAQLLSLDHLYGQYVGRVILDFIKENKIKDIDFIASHGHTVFHQPSNGFTYQLGNGQTIHVVSGLPVVSDFRSLDVIRGGEGAPLVPIGDRYFFNEYDVCLNLGGIANLSMEVKGARVAYDFCFANMGLNYLAAKVGKEFDKDGVLASSGVVNDMMLKKLDAVYKPLRRKRPSLGREGFEKSIRSIVNNSAIPLPNRLRTFCESIAIETANAIPVGNNNLKMLVTGGGALNSFLVKTLKRKLEGRAKVVIPKKQVIEFKEAVVFALLGVLRVRGEVNCLKSVTGAIRDSSGGVMVGFNS